MTIRPAAAPDVRRLAELNALVQEMHRAVAPDWFKPADLDAIAHYFHELFDTERAHIFVAEVDGEVRGYVLARVYDAPENALTFGGTVVEIDQIGVDPDHRGTGLGRQLLERVQDLARELDARRTQLTVWDFNTRARAVFERAGFVTTMRRMQATLD